MLLAAGLAAVTLAACGSDDKSSNESARSTTAKPAGTTGASGASGATGATGASPLAASPGAAKKRKSGGSSPPSLGTGGGSANPPASTPAGETKPSAPRPKRKKQPTFAPGSFAGQGKELYRQAKIICDYLTLDGLAHEYNVKPKTPEAVARRYAKAYPKNARDDVYRGCKAGLES